MIVLERAHTRLMCARNHDTNHIYTHTHNTLMSFSINTQTHTHKEIVNVVKPKMENTTSSEPDIPIYNIYYNVTS